MLNYIYGYKGSGDLNEIKTNLHKFVFNVQNAPESYGFLDVSHFDGRGFSPSTTGVIRQRFTGWNTGNEYTRCFYGDKWTPWKSDSWTHLSSVTAVGLTEQAIALPENAKYANEIIVSFNVHGAIELSRNIVLVPNIVINSGAFLYRSDTQRASVYAQYINNQIFVGAHILTGLTINADVSYR